MVVTVDRGRFTALVDERPVSATKARHLGRTGVIVGDRVKVVGDTSGAEGTLARIVEVAERETVLRRTADDDDPYERPIVANADQLVIVTALADPPPRTGMIDRILVAGFDAGIAPLLCLTKADLASPADAGRPVRAPRRAGPGHLARRGPGSAAGVAGRSSQRLRRPLRGGQVDPGQRPDPRRRRGPSARSTRSPGAAGTPPARRLRCGCPVSRDGSWVIDTPGVRSFGLSHVSRDRIVAAFADLAAITADCPRGCSHEADAPECALDVAVADGRLAPVRLESFRRMLGSGQ